MGVEDPSKSQFLEDSKQEVEYLIKKDTAKAVAAAIKATESLPHAFEKILDTSVQAHSTPIKHKVR